MESYLIGQKRNQLEIKEIVGKSKSGQLLLNCLCDCGEYKIVARNHWYSGATKSCGCLNLKKNQSTIGERSITHGMSKTPEWYAYWAATRRCSPNNKEKREDYYDRGIRFKFDSFEQFFSEVGLKPSPKHSLDRINNDGHYEPGNVRWATATQQIRNQRCGNCTKYKAQIFELEKRVKELQLEVDLKGW
jgi:hypothetical protein